MADKAFGQDDPRMLAYAEGVFRPEDAVQREIRNRTEAEGLPAIQVSPMDALHLEVLARAFGASKIVEIGTLAGYSGVALARALPPHGRLYTFEADHKHADQARESFAKAGVAEKVEVFVGPAMSNLSRIESHAPFDLVFIDADKANYPNYLGWAQRHLRKGGVVLADNTFGWGMIGDESFDDPEDELKLRALQAFNREIAQNGAFRATILPTGEGLTLGVKL